MSTLGEGVVGVPASSLDSNSCSSSFGFSLADSAAAFNTSVLKIELLPFLGLVGHEFGTLKLTTKDQSMLWA